MNVPLFGDVLVTVSDGVGGVISGVPVYVFKDTIYTNRNGTTDVNGQVTFNLPEGDYNFRADVNGVQYFSADTGGPCTVTACTSTTVTAAVFADVTVTVANANGSVGSGVPVYVFSGTTYTNRTAQTDGNGQVSFTLPAGAYNFRADIQPSSGGPAYQYFSGSGNDTCIVPDNCNGNTDTVTVPVFENVTVTVSDDNGGVDSVPVYVFSGTTYTNRNATTDPSGQVIFDLPAGDYNFRADIEPSSGGPAYQYFSGTGSGNNNCTIPGCGATGNTITVPVFGNVAVTVNDSGAILAGQTVYVFDTNQAYLNRSGQTGGAGEPFSFNLPAGSYLFASDFAGSRYFSTQCDVPSCTSAVVASSIAADLGIAKSVDNTVSTGGGTVVFTLVASNDGPFDATNVTVADSLPAGLNYSSDDGNGAYDSNTGVWTIGNLAANATATLHITALVGPNNDGQTLVNSAAISSDAVVDDNPQNDTASAGVSVGVSTLCARPGTIGCPTALRCQSGVTRPALAPPTTRPRSPVLPSWSTRVITLVSLWKMALVRRHRYSSRDSR